MMRSDPFRLFSRYILRERINYVALKYMMSRVKVEVFVSREGEIEVSSWSGSTSWPNFVIFDNQMINIWLCKKKIQLTSLDQNQLKTCTFYLNRCFSLVIMTISELKRNYIFITDKRIILMRHNPEIWEIFKWRDQSYQCISSVVLWYMKLSQLSKFWCLTFVHS